MPALNEEKNIADAVRDICAVLPAHFAAWEVVVVDDGSTDRTHEIAEALARGNQDVRVLRHHTPQGLGRVMRDGVEAARHEWVIYVPGDNDMDAASLGAIFREVGKADIIVGDPRTLPLRYGYRRVISRATTWFLNWVSGLHLPYYNGLALYRRTDLLRIPSWSSSFAFQGEVLMRMILGGRTCRFVSVRRRDTIRERERETKAFRPANILGVLATFLRLIWIVRFRGGFQDRRQAP